MIELLARRLIPGYPNTEDPHVRRRCGMLCGLVGIVLNVLLCALKLFAGLLSGSIAITADALNNLSDAGSSVVSLLGFHLAAQEPDRDHPFGHGRMEYISGLIVAMLIILMGFELLKSSVEKIIRPEAVDFHPVILLILALSIAVKLYMCAYNRRLGQKIRSSAMAATAADSLSDAAATTAVLLATLAGHYTRLPLDGWFGLLVALFVLRGGWSAAQDTISPLLGQPPSPEFVGEVEALVLSHPEIIGVHDLIVHDYGPGRLMITLHAEVRCDGDMIVLHDVVDTVEGELGRQMHCLATIHMDPVSCDEAVSEKREEVAALLRTIDERISIHDFRMVEGPTHTNLIFDAQVPFDLPLTDREAALRIRALIQTMPGNYFAVVKVEKGYL